MIDVIPLCLAHKGSSGQALVEFSLVVLLLVLVAVWLITIPASLAWDHWVAHSVAESAAQDGADAYVSGGSSGACQTATASANQQISEALFVQNEGVSYLPISAFFSICMTVVLLIGMYQEQPKAAIVAPQ